MISPTRLTTRRTPCGLTTKGKPAVRNSLLILNRSCDFGLISMIASSHEVKRKPTTLQNERQSVA